MVHFGPVRPILWSIYSKCPTWPKWPSTEFDKGHQYVQESTIKKHMYAIARSWWVAAGLYAQHLSY